MNEMTSASARDLRMRLPPRLLTLDRSCREPANELPLPRDQESERRYRDHDDTRHDDTPPGGFLEAQLRHPDLGRTHERLVGDEQRPEVLVVRRQEAVDTDGGEGRT